VERFLRKRRFLEKDERILELKHGRIRRWLVDGSDQPVPKLHGLERVPMFSGMATLSYSARCLFCVGTDKCAITDLCFHCAYLVRRAAIGMRCLFDRRRAVRRQRGFDPVGLQ
jgi:hypothetical protein